MSSAKGPELWDLGNEVESRASQAIPHTNSEGSVKGQPLALWVYGRVFVVYSCVYLFIFLKFCNGGDGTLGLGYFKQLLCHRVVPQPLPGGF